ncbi:MAG: PrsW family intramembrane metalloprotease [Chloroflexi bacterium]|nr:PrsW family intramembrane metalloprotease [Chloroflexota bacterium]OQB01896.1 MAG: hypothetical protein BWY25_00864 [Chloroflexi bacterium ADurb.Bin222]
MQNRRSVLWIIMTLVALLLLAVSLGCLGLAFLAPTMRTIEAEQRNLSALLLASMGVLGLSVTAVLLWSCLEGSAERPAPLFYPRRAWITLAAGWLLSLAGAALLLSAGTLNFLAAPLHVALVILPALLLYAVAALVGGRGAGVTRRQATLLSLSGAFSTLPALLAEGVGILASGLLVGVGASLIPGGAQELERLMEQLNQWSQLPPQTITPESLTTLFSSPVVLAIAFLTLAVITPFVEELLKTLGVVVVGFRRRPQPLQAFLWGAAAGLGFAIIEGVLNSSMSLTDGASWVAGVGARLPASAMHIFASGLVGLGWGYFWEGHQRWRVVGCYLIAMVFHGLWNFSVIVVAGIQSAASLPAAFTNAATIGGALVVGALTLIAVVGIVGIPLRLRKRAGA